MLPAMGSRLFRYLDSRKWPTNRQFEWRYRELSRELGELKVMVGELRESLNEARTREERLVAWQAETRTRLRRTQALTARVYEALQRWPDQLAQARRESSYELSYDDPDPLITVAISTYHSPATLCERALASVRAQTYSNWEAIVVGDHCTDDTEQRVRAIGDDRIRFHNLPVREREPEDPWEAYAVKGSVPRAVGVELSRGHWIAPMSHDDEWDLDHLQTLLDAARASRCELAYSRMRVVEGGPDSPPTRSVGAWPPHRGGFHCQASMFHGCLRFLRYDRACALASEPNDWNLARRAWEAGVRFHFVDRETATLFVTNHWPQIHQRYASMGMPPNATASP